MSRGAVLYEVTLSVERAIAGEYRAWLDAHVAQMLALPGFTGAEVFELVETPPDAARLVLCVHYRLRDEAALEAYLRDHAVAMRADGIARFGDRFRASRRVLRPAAG